MEDESSSTSSLASRPWSRRTAPIRSVPATCWPAGAANAHQVVNCSEAPCSRKEKASRFVPSRGGDPGQIGCRSTSTTPRPPPRPKDAPTVICTRRVDFGGPGTYSGGVSGTGTFVLALPSLFAPCHRYRRLAFGSYGFGHTTMRQPGDLRGTVIGRKGRYRSLFTEGGDA